MAEDEEYVKPTRHPYKFGSTRREAYLDKIRSGLGRFASARAVGIHPQTYLDTIKACPEFKAAVEQAEIEACDPIENALYQKALSGDNTAIQFHLTNRNPDRWKDRRAPRNDVNIQLPPDINALKEELLKKIKEIENG